MSDQEPESTKIDKGPPPPGMSPEEWNRTVTPGTIRLPADYQYGGEPPTDSPRGTRAIPSSVQEADEQELAEMPEATIQEWLEDRPEVQEWVPLSNLRKKILVRALDEPTRRGIRREAPVTKVRGRGRQMVSRRDSDWIQLEMLRRCIVVPDFTEMDKTEAHKKLSRALSGEVFTLVRKINELSGFNMDDLIGDSGEELE